MKQEGGRLGHTCLLAATWHISPRTPAPATSQEALQLTLSGAPTSALAPVASQGLPFQQVLQVERLTELHWGCSLPTEA